LKYEYLTPKVFPSVLWHCWLGNMKGNRSVKTSCWFVGDISTGAAPIKFRMETFWWPLTKVQLENGR